MARVIARLTLREGLFVAAKPSAAVELLAGDGRPCLSLVTPFFTTWDCDLVREGRDGLDTSGASLLDAGVKFSTEARFLGDGDFF